MITLQSGLTISNHNSRLFFFTPVRRAYSSGSARIDYLIRFSGMFQARTSGLNGRDTHVRPVANDHCAKSLQLGTRIDTVRFLMARAYVDANREMPDESNLDPDICGQRPWTTGFFRPYIRVIMTSCAD